MPHLKAWPHKLTSYYFDAKGSNNNSREEVNNKNFFKHVKGWKPAKAPVRVTESIAGEETHGEYVFLILHSTLIFPV